VQSAKILLRTILFKGNLAQPRKYCPTKYLGYTVYTTKQKKSKTIVNSQDKNSDDSGKSNQKNDCEPSFRLAHT